MTYVTQDSDLEFRRVGVESAVNPNFEPVDHPGQEIFYQEKYVLEIRRKDGSTHLEYSGAKMQLSYSVQINDPHKMLLSKCSTARIWARRKGENGILYKVPSRLPEEGNNYVLYFRGPASSVELCGDKYFSMVYTF